MLKGIERRNPRMTGNTSEIRPLVAGNWKMNGLKASLAQAFAVRDGLKATRARPR